MIAARPDPSQMEWINPKGYSAVIDHYKRQWLIWRVPVWQITLDDDEPLTLRLDEHCYCQPSRRYFSDFGSIPPWLTWLPGFGRTRFAKSFLVHDSACKYHGLWFSSTYGGKYAFSTMPSKRVHQYLEACAKTEGANVANARAIYRAVRLFGPQWVTDTATN